MFEKFITTVYELKGVIAVGLVLGVSAGAVMQWHSDKYADELLTMGGPVKDNGYGALARNLDNVYYKFLKRTALKVETWIKRTASKFKTWIKSKL